MKIEAGRHLGRTWYRIDVRYPTTRTDTKVGTFKVSHNDTVQPPLRQVRSYIREGPSHGLKCPAIVKNKQHLVTRTCGCHFGLANKLWPKFLRSRYCGPSRYCAPNQCALFSPVQLRQACILPLKSDYAREHTNEHPINTAFFQKVIPILKRSSLLPAAMGVLSFPEIWQCASPCLFLAIHEQDQKAWDLRQNVQCMPF